MNPLQALMMQMSLSQPGQAPGLLGSDDQAAGGPQSALGETQVAANGPNYGRQPGHGAVGKPAPQLMGGSGGGGGTNPVGAAVGAAVPPGANIPGIQYHKPFGFFTGSGSQGDVAEHNAQVYQEAWSDAMGKFAEFYRNNRIQGLDPQHAAMDAALDPQLIKHPMGQMVAERAFEMGKLIEQGREGELQQSRLDNANKTDIIRTGNQTYVRAYDAQGNVIGNHLINMTGEQVEQALKGAQARNFTAAAAKENAEAEKTRTITNFLQGKNADGSSDPNAKGGGPIYGTAKAIHDGLMPPLTGRALTSPEGMAIQAQLDKMGPYDAGKFERYKKGTEYWTEGQGGVSIERFQTAIQHLNTFTELAKELDNTDTPMLNRVFQAIGKATGQAAPTNAEIAKHMLAKEMAAAVLSANGGGGEAERLALEGDLDRAGSPGQLSGAGETFQGLLAGRMNSMERRFNSTFDGHPMYSGKFREFAKISPEASAVMDRTRSVYAGDAAATPVPVTQAGAVAENSANTPTPKPSEGWSNFTVK